MPKPKYKTLLQKSDEEIAKDEAELKAQEADYATQGVINDLKLRASKLSREIEEAKRAVPFDPENLVDLLNEKALVDRRLSQIEEVHSELF